MKDLKSLVKLSTYARLKCMSIGWVYQLVKEEKIEVLEIDGMKFVDLEKSNNQIKNNGKGRS